MNKTKIKLAIGALSLVTLASCSKNLLNLNPPDSIALGEAFQQVSDAEKWDGGIYATLRGNTNGGYTMAPDIQADELNATLDYGNNYGGIHTWQGFTAGDYEISGEWSAYYAAISTINAAIEGYPNIKTSSPSDVAEMNELTGDAYLARAFYYHKLVLRWAKAYDPSSASTDLGVPLMLKYDVSALPARATVADTYTQIMSDITTARALLDGVTGQAGSIYFTQDAVLALEARVKLCMHDWAGAKAAADSVIATGNYPLITSQAAFNSYWLNDDPGETIMQPNISQTNERPNANTMYINYNVGTGEDDPYYMPAQWVVDMYDNADIRKTSYYTNTSVNFLGNTYTNVWVVGKFPGNPILQSAPAPQSNYQNAPKIFRVAEDYLISAEAAVQAGNPGAAAAPLNALRTARGLAALGTVALQDVMDERTRELAFEGFRLDDLKRWNLGFTRHNPQNTAMLVGGANYLGQTQAAGADKFVWGLPTNDITINHNLVQNQGW
ncbi:MAG TPA: RagB/SusD family nutrient uptake outer membrane protein [Dinghuibacter sp.]|jgi:hypothetical protein|uniref:RagB/SusD family nutrient uptake outer membrane protein n=1 Tax=Dinghuibacter sp. TaxID=2024697 RepID=UPI002BFDCBB7|nr:RagB/SusD family nutrient uptake outer membrane protein [Dinghuibacter sp.]HTJ13980.1 RagB/SusD family nutrient uptake outer membrane protein [Dinghuibacter sp.]